jgi:hypothetical protein
MSKVSPSYKILVPGKDRSQVESQIIYGARKNQNGLLSGNAASSTFTITVADNDFSDDAFLYLGPHLIISGVHFTVGGTAALTAAALATCIDNLPGFSATDNVADVEISGPLGPIGGTIKVRAKYSGSIINYTLDPSNGFFNVGGPYIGPPNIT